MGRVSTTTPSGSTFSVLRQDRETRFTNIQVAVADNVPEVVGAALCAVLSEASSASESGNLTVIGSG
jgi:hypothetical protein